jgi:hypothetical protein
LNPDYQIQKQKVLQEGVRIAYAKNQRWPQLDLKASYGLNGLGIDPGESWRDVGTRDFPSWSVGVEMRVPLAGGIKSRNDLAAAKLRQTRALLGLKEVEVQIDNGLDTAVQKVRTAFESINNYEAAVRFARDLLTTQVARLDVGQVESRKVLEVEADLFQAKNAVLEAKVLYQRSLLELSLIEGSVLKARRADLTQRELESKTSLLVQNGQVTEEQYRRFMAELRWRFENKSGGLDPTAEASARQALAQTTDQLRGSAATTAPMSPEDYGKARQVLHEMQLKNPPIPGRP